LAGLKTYLPLFPEISYGDKISVEGLVNGDKLDKPKLVDVKPSSQISKFRNNIISFYQKTLPQPESGLVSGILLGSKGALTQDFYDLTKKTGVAHVVVASGTNVTFVVSFLMGILVLFMSRKKAIYFCIFGILGYLFMSGFDAPLIRAAIMASVLFMAQETGRLVSTWRVLLITAGIMLIIKPDWLIDIGFILSFVSVSSILFFEPKISKWTGKLFSTTIAAQIGVAPILFVTFGQFNILSPIVNALVLWTIPMIMVLGGFGGVVGLIWPFLGKIILYL
jgi:competence protein ComEC